MAEGSLQLLQFCLEMIRLFGIQSTSLTEVWFVSDQKCDALGDRY